MKKIFRLMVIICMGLCFLPINIFALENSEISTLVNTNLKDSTESYDFTYNISNEDTIKLLFGQIEYGTFFQNYIQDKLNNNNYVVSIDNIDNNVVNYSISDGQTTYNGVFIYNLNRNITLDVDSGYSDITEIQNYLTNNYGLGSSTITSLGNNQYNIQIGSITQNLVFIFNVNTVTNNAPLKVGVVNYQQQAETSVSYQTHVQNVGWQQSVSNGVMSGTTGRSLRLEGIKINVLNSSLSGSIMYQTHVQNIGWQDWVSDGDISGTTGMSLRLEAIRIKLTGELADSYDIYYCVHVQNMGWLGWAKNGEAAGSAGYSYRLEGIKIMIVPKGENFDVGAVEPYVEHEPLIYSNAHVQNIGWTGVASNRETVGITGQSLRIEALTLSIYNYGGLSGSIQYSTHIQNIGWQDWVSDGAISGTTGRSLRIEAIKIKLTGDLADKYDIYYRAHVQNYGWLDWAKNGEEAGSKGLSYRMEAIQIVLVEKGGNAPGSTTKPFVTDKWITENGEVYYYNADGVMATGFKVVDGVKYFFNSLGQLRGTNVKHVIDVSKHQGTIDWDSLWASGEVDAVILRIGFGQETNQLDSQFEYNLSAVKRLGIPYSVYHYSYAYNTDMALAEANLLISWFSKYSLNPSFNVYYDLENWKLQSSGVQATDLMNSDTCAAVATTYLTRLNQAGIGSSIYTYTDYANNMLYGVRSSINWIAQYNNNCAYTGSYIGWQYTSSDTITGITGNVDSSVWYS